MVAVYDQHFDNDLDHADPYADLVHGQHSPGTGRLFDVHPSGVHVVIEREALRRRQTALGQVRHLPGPPRRFAGGEHPRIQGPGGPPISDRQLRLPAVSE